MARTDVVIGARYSLPVMFRVRVTKGFTLRMWLGTRLVILGAKLIARRVDFKRIDEEEFE